MAGAAAGVALLATTVTTGHVPAGPATRPAGAETVQVIVRSDRVPLAVLAAEVGRSGGTVTRALGSTGMIVATVPAVSLPALRSAPGVAAVTADASVRLTGGAWKPDGDPFSMFKVDTISGAIAAFAKRDAAGRKITGKGVGVAVIDSGITPVKGLGGTGKVVNGPDLSFESRAANLRNLDTFGHGTHMAGIIAGRDPEVAPNKENDNQHLVGMAPDATLVNLKVAAADGAVDVSQVIAGIDWAVAHRDDPELNIRVLNLSFGTDSVQDPRMDPLSHAVESAWRHGIVVVVAAGNDGVTTSRLRMPAANPYVLAVGAADSNGTDGKADDLVGEFSNGGNATRHPDLLALGRSIASLRVPGSYIDASYPGGLIPNDPYQRYFRGSGTSQATAVVSGAVALLLQQRPTLTPDQVKYLLTSTATRLDARKAPLSGNPQAQGAGELNLQKALDTPTPAAAQTWAASLGTGSLEAARGSAFVADPVTGVELHGEQDIMGRAWNATSWSTQATNCTAWDDDTWNGTTWSSRTWSSTTWTGATWSSRTWSDATWTGTTWSSRTWSSRTWSGDGWSAAHWP
jgi:serine protease AprX